MKMATKVSKVAVARTGAFKQMFGNLQFACCDHLAALRPRPSYFVSAHQERQHQPVLKHCRGDTNTAFAIGTDSSVRQEALMLLASFRAITAQ
jgi:hypothetical protein